MARYNSEAVSLLMLLTFLEMKPTHGYFRDSWRQYNDSQVENQSKHVLLRLFTARVTRNRIRLRTLCLSKANCINVKFLQQYQNVIVLPNQTQKEAKVKEFSVKKEAKVKAIPAQKVGVWSFPAQKKAEVKTAPKPVT